MATTHFEGEDVIITFEKEGADTVTNVELKITNISTTAGSGDVETIRTFGGGSIQINKPTGEYEVSFDYVTNDSSFAEVNLDDGAAQGLPGVGTEYRSGSEAGKKRWRVTMWFLGTGTAISKSGSVVVPKNQGEIYRHIYKDVFSISNDETFAADGHATGTITLRTSATDEDAYPNVFREYTSAQGTTALTVLNSTAHRGALTWNTTTPAWSGSYRT